jgi:hypothetical protein
VRGFNNFAQAKPLRLVLKITDTSRIGKFVYDLGSCATVTGLSKKTNQIIAASKKALITPALSYFGSSANHQKNSQHMQTNCLVRQ